jgi:transposase InsO family protein
MVQACADAGLRRSMGATGICWDNSGAESLWSTFKHEYYYRHVFATKSVLVAAVDKWMHFYNNQPSFGDWHAQPDRLRTITQRGHTSRAPLSACTSSDGNGVLGGCPDETTG